VKVVRGWRVEGLSGDGEEEDEEEMEVRGRESRVAISCWLRLADDRWCSVGWVLKRGVGQAYVVWSAHMSIELWRK
jgi:hypothetical protein